MASMRDIKRRRESIQSTGQITKAMKLISTVKLQKSAQRAESYKQYSKMMYQTIRSILSNAGPSENRYKKIGGSGRKAVLAVTANRGMAGGYSSSIVKIIETSQNLAKSDTLIYAAGKKGHDSFHRKGYTVAESYSEAIEKPVYQDAVLITESLLEAFAKGSIGEIYLAYTSYKNTVSHTPRLIRLLPLDQTEEADQEIKSYNLADKGMVPMNYEPSEEEVLEFLIPKYISSIIYGALLESTASEHSARMSAMDTATNNAKDMIDVLSLQFNRARQGAITQELTEIIAGSGIIS